MRMSEWKEYNLTEVCDTISDTYRDSAEKVVLINTSDVLEGNVTNHELVPNKNLAGQFKKKFQKDDILYSEIRPANRRYAYVDFEPKDYIASTKLMVLRSKPCILPKYLYYLLTNNTTIRTLHAIAVGRSGTFPQITYSELANIKFQLPSLKEQEEILSTLLYFDDKIVINRRICENLEAQAQALFKHWFIDFAPFKDDKFVESDLGMIPEGWRVVSLDDACIKITDGSHYSPKDDPHGTIPMLSVKDMLHNGFDYSSCKMINEEEYEKMKANDCIPLKNDILVAKDGSYLKEIFLCFKEERQAILSSIALFRCNINVLYPELLLQLLRLPRVRKDVGDNYVSGSALPRIVLKDFKKFRFVIAPIDVQNRIIDTMQSLTNEIHINEMESRKLAQLRDVLLPKLMSGQIKL